MLHYSVTRTKEKVNFTSDDHLQISYEERAVYQFDELLSYESLDEKVTVANAELMVLNPFILTMVRRASAVQRISRSLNATVNQILRLYEANLFIERPVHRIIFGPNGNEEKDDAPLPTMPEITGPEGDAEGFGNESISLMKLQLQNSGKL